MCAPVFRSPFEVRMLNSDTSSRLLGDWSLEIGLSGLGCLGSTSVQLRVYGLRLCSQIKRVKGSQMVGTKVPQLAVCWGPRKLGSHVVSLDQTSSRNASDRLHLMQALEHCRPYPQALSVVNRVSLESTIPTMVLNPGILYTY